MNLETAMEEIKGKRRQQQILAFVCLVVGLIGLAFFFFGKRMPALILLSINVLYYLLVLKKCTRGYNDAIAKANILGSLCSPLKEAKYTSRAGMDPKEFVDRSLLPANTSGNALLLRQGFSGEKDGDTYQGWECTFHFPRGMQRRTDYEFHSGTILTADYDTAWEKEKVKGNETGKDQKKNQKKEAGNASKKEAKKDVESERETKNNTPGALLLRSGIFTDDAITYSLSAKGYEKSEEGPCILYQRKEALLPEEIKEKALHLFEKEKTLACLRMEETRALAYLEKRFYTVDVKPRDLPTIEQLRRNPLPERDSIWGFFKQWKRSR